MDASFRLLISFGSVNRIGYWLDGKVLGFVV